MGEALDQNNDIHRRVHLYYSRLQGTTFKWLDVVALFRDQILKGQDPGAEATAVKFFTAPVKANFARHGAASEQAQEQYHRALRASYPELVEVIQGFHIFRPTSLPSHVEGQLPSKTNRARVWMIEEKLTDVNLALHVYRDAIRGAVEQLVICSNDSDLEPALKFVRRDAPDVKIGLVMPLRVGAKGQGMISNKRLTAQATWIRHHILDEETRIKPVAKTRADEKEACQQTRALVIILEVLEGLPLHVWPERRRKLSYLNPVLSRAEINSGYKPARKLCISLCVTT